MRRVLVSMSTMVLLLGTVATPAVALRAAPHTDEPTAAAALRTGQVDLQLITGGLSSPVGVVNAGDGTNRLFVIQQGGSVRVVQNHRLLSGSFLSMSGISGGFSSGGERGLLGLAFHPSFETNRRLFVYYTRGDGDIMIAEFLANASRTSAAFSKFILRVEHSSAGNHNGGQLLFGPDGFLYIFTGDGGGGGDPGENAQDPGSLLGKVLRVSINTGGQGEFDNYSFPSDNPYVGSAGLDEIYDIGMRNPWRASFDRASNDLWIADVGQGSYEEINRRRVGTDPGVNWGWDCREGKHWFETAGCDTTAPVPYTDPVSEYGHGGGNCSVTGGHVYRGAKQRDLVGQYVVGDYCSGRLWTLLVGNSTLILHRDTSALISSFGESEDGEIYMTDHAGRLYRVVAPPFSDITNSGFIDEIMWAYYEGITGGCGSGRYCPGSTVTREQMASFLSRVLGLPAATQDYFTDDESSPHEADINRLAASGITGGCATNRFCPASGVARAQMASFLVRARTYQGRALPATSTDFFDDDDNNIHEGNINRLAASGITGGCGTRMYCPSGLVTRGQMAAFLKRAFQ